MFLQFFTIFLLLYRFSLVVIDFPFANIIANILVDIEIPLSATDFFVELRGQKIVYECGTSVVQKLCGTSFSFYGVVLTVCV